MFGVLLVKLLNSSLCIDQLLLARKKRMTLRANIDVYGLLCRQCLKRRSTGTYRLDLMYFRMNFLFHVNLRILTIAKKGDILQ